MEHPFLNPCKYQIAGVNLQSFLLQEHRGPRNLQIKCHSQVVASQQLLAKEQPLKATGCHWFLQNTFNPLGSRHCHLQAWNPTKSCRKSMWQLQQVWRPCEGLGNVHCSHALQMYTFLPLWHKAIQSSRIAWDILCWTQANIILRESTSRAFCCKNRVGSWGFSKSHAVPIFWRSTTHSCAILPFFKNQKS